MQRFESFLGSQVEKQCNLRIALLLYRDKDYLDKVKVMSNETSIF